MKPLVTASFVFSLLQTLCSFAAADHFEKSHPVVAGYERFLEVEEVSDFDRGALLINELNCQACHSLESTWPVEPRIAPKLSDVGSRVQANFFERFLRDPHGTKPGTSMPDLLAVLSEEERTDVANALAHFLASTGKTAHQPTTPKQIQEGKKLFHETGCVACHNPQETDQQISTSIPLGNLAEKYTLPGLVNFIRNPLHSRPSGRMPQLPLTDTEFRQIGAYLLRDVKVDANINFAFYSGTWDKLPNFEELTPELTGTVMNLDVQAFPKKDNFGVVFSGYWETDRDQEYKFELNSDDGSRLIIDGQTVIDNDGVHGMKRVVKSKQIRAGLHEVRIEFFEKGGGEEVHCHLSGPGLPRQPIEGLLRKDRKLPFGETSFVVDLKRAAQGKEHFQSLGCANCHEMELEGTRLRSQLRPVSISKTDSGCLANSTMAPQFQLNAEQSRAIVESLEGNPENENVTKQDLAQARIHKTMMTLNCYTCHSRETGDRGDSDNMIWGGVTDPTGDSYEVFERYDWFKGTDGEMGDEGRVPPGLKLVGAKLNPDWLRQIMTDSSKDRPYMKTHMPKFGVDNVKKLIEDLEIADQLPETISVTQSATEEELKTHGRFLVGGKALSCIKCHTFGPFPATGLQAISLTTMAKRLDKDWFQVYMHKPSRFRRGTRMPESWPRGKTFYPDMLDGDTDKQINAVWKYLTDGPDAVRPKGLMLAKMELVAQEEPIVYRNFIEGAGPRAIGVGYPEGVNVAFDADAVRMALIWQENFIDAKRHWTGRGQGFEPPLGTKVLKLGDGPEFSLDLANWLGTNNKEDSRKAGYQFLGYEFDEERRPTFLYQVENMKVFDKPVPSDSASNTIAREITVIGNRTAYLRAATGANIEQKGNAFVVDGKLNIQIEGAVKPSIVGLPGKKTLVVEIPFENSPTRFKQTYQW